MKKKLSKKNRAHLQNLFQQAQVFFNSGRLNDAHFICENILQLDAAHADTLHLVGLIHHRFGDVQSAIAWIEKAAQAEPRSGVFLTNLGTMYSQAGAADRAAASYKRALEIEPRSAPTYLNLGAVYSAMQRYDDAIAAYRKSIALNPNNPEAYNNLGMDLERTGLLDEAAEQLRRAVALNPNFHVAYHKLLFLLSYYCLCSTEQLLEAHRQWDAIHGERGRHLQFSHARQGDPDKRLRIGYVSPDFRRHPVSTFIEPLLAMHHRANVEVYCYAEVFEPDEGTRRLQTLADQWRATVHLGDEQVARMIHDDRIDILIDLAGHTAYNRLAVFTYKSAPIQATYLGYCATTGLSTMDYWITDEVLHPEGARECAAETIYRLPRCWLAYQPPAGAPEVLPRPDRAPLTFGSFNNIRKLGDAVVAAWADILDRVPGSRLLLKSRYLDDAYERRVAEEKFRRRGVGPDRLQLQGAAPFPEYLNVYNEVDVALDTFPRSGGTTAADALWMGVPVITLAGERYVERLAASKLAAIGRREWIANSVEEYVALAVTVAHDTSLRAEVRQTQRARMAASQLCDADDLANALENAYRAMWRRYLNLG